MKSCNKAFYEKDSWLKPYQEIIIRRSNNIKWRKDSLAGRGGRLYDSINNHLYYMLHNDGKDWLFREYAPNATKVYLIGDFNGWKISQEYALQPLGNGNWELKVPLDRVHHGDLYKWYIEWPGGAGERIPTYANRCVQDDHTKIFSAQVWSPATPYKWKRKWGPKVTNPFIYETHIGMATEREGVGTFEEFRLNVLPHIAELGYNVIQIMALQEHPYYGSFGYQVANFFALSSRFGTPEEFKALVDDAHKRGIAVIMDIVHSHSVMNETESLSKFDGSTTLYFHAGDRGFHPAWKTRCFDYGKNETLHLLLSNCKYWCEEYHLDGFRFDGVTSMLYYDHGLERDFMGYESYFDGGQDEDAITYLGLANILIKEINPKSITIAEDMSGMPGLAVPIKNGGVGFDYRMSMGIADHWIKWIKELEDWQWSVGEIFYQLSNKREDEKTISYAECHDQALVGDKTLIFRLMDKEMYFSMNLESQNLIVDRGIALHKMIRLVTAATAGNGYLTFMGNEFGHPEWIDFPREGNGWSYKHARRQWSLSEADYLRYRPLMLFDRDMVHLFIDNKILKGKLKIIRQDEEKKILIFSRREYLFVFNFNPSGSFSDYMFDVPAGKWSVVLESDATLYNGFDRIDTKTEHFTQRIGKEDLLSLYIPSRTCMVLKRE